MSPWVASYRSYRTCAWCGRQCTVRDDEWVHVLDNDRRCWPTVHCTGEYLRFATPEYVIPEQP